MRLYVQYPSAHTCGHFSVFYCLSGFFLFYCAWPIPINCPFSSTIRNKSPFLNSPLNAVTPARRRLVARGEKRAVRAPALMLTSAWAKPADEAIHFLTAGRGSPRSEERRVGKECRSRWSPDQ